jgi:Protein of unknown function (DUF3224)
MPHAAGIFDVKLVPRSPQSDDEPTIGRLLLDKQYHGELDGPSKGDMLSNQIASTGAAVYVAVERFAGTLQGRQGSFVLAHVGTATREAQKLNVIIVPGSGTDELAGIQGTMNIKIVDKKHLYEVDYELPNG